MINERYDTTMMRLLYASRCNVIMTAGIRGAGDDTPLDILGNLGVAPRGQKELGHQPHTLLLLHQRKQGKEVEFLVSTGKDIGGRPYFDNSPCYDLSLQYLANYVR